MAENWTPVLRAPRDQEPYHKIMRQEHAHAVWRVGDPQAVCGYETPSGWIERAISCEVTCLGCRRVLGLGPNTITKDDPHFSYLLTYK